VGYAGLGERFAAPGDEPLLLESGRRLGQGLQLVNILRDLHEDLPAGRCYLPAGELRADGWDGASAPPAAVLEPVWNHWLATCRDHLAAGHDYVERVRNRRVRFSTKLPLLLAEATADRLARAGVERVMREKVKVGRREVRRAMLRALA